MILIIGLGNPGIKYKNTRHNMGFIILDNILDKIDWNKSSKANALYFRDKIDSKEIEYLKPQTFMNESGFSVSYAQKKYEIKSEDIVVIHDDVDLPFGKIKISYDKGDGGHNGIKSIMNHIKSVSFVRIRVGISILDESQIMHKPNVLGKFSIAEMKIIKEDISTKVNSIIQTLVKEGREVAMNKFNIN